MMTRDCYYLNSATFGSTNTNEEEFQNERTENCYGKHVYKRDP